jgi:hypothetical protein
MDIAIMVLAVLFFFWQTVSEWLAGRRAALSIITTQIGRTR